MFYVDLSTTSQTLRDTVDGDRERGQLKLTRINCQLITEVEHLQISGLELCADYLPSQRS